VRGFSELADHEPIFRRHALHPYLLDIVADLIGTPFSVSETQSLLKPPSIGSPKPPHQDNAYLQVEPPDALVTGWCALDDATIENGCMRYVPGSHRLGMISHTWLSGTTHQVPSGVDEGQCVAVPVKAGAVIFHHSLTLHCSGENRSTNWRRAMICHYVRDDADLSKAIRSAQPLIPALGR
jgi:ectoine hydroxylase-related dioxygenase (phytanoyl-CoA dioxygenase family)